jgi:ribosomal protein S21
MTLNVHIAKTGTKTTAKMVQEFTRKIQSLGMVRELRNKRYYAKKHTNLSRHTNAIKRLTKRAEITKLIKEGKLAPRVPRTSRTPSSSAPSTNA